MTRERQRLGDYLSHIFEAIERIQRYTAGLGRSEYLRNELVQDAVIRNLEVIGEASRNIQRDHPDFASQHPELPLNFAYEMRNALAHGYFQIDQEIVWATVQRDLPNVKALVGNLRNQLSL